MLKIYNSRWIYLVSSMHIPFLFCRRHPHQEINRETAKTCRHLFRVPGCLMGSYFKNIPTELTKPSRPPPHFRCQFTKIPIFFKMFFERSSTSAIFAGKQNFYSCFKIWQALTSKSVEFSWFGAKTQTRENTCASTLVNFQNSTKWGIISCFFTSICHFGGQDVKVCSLGE